MVKRRNARLCLWLVVALAAFTLLVAGRPGGAQEQATAAGPDPASEQQVATAPRTVFEFFLAGGKVMWVILACSVVALAFVIERCFSLRRKNVVDDAHYDRIVGTLEAEGLKSARALAEQRSSPMSRVMASVLRCAAGGQTEMQAVLEDAGARELWDLSRNAKSLGVISNVAPLLGLLGTVLGIIRAFSDVAAETGAIGNPAKLATGIYEALITTAFGLSVAIPTFLFFHFFRDKADALVRDIEEKALKVIAVVTESAHGAADESA